MGMRIRKQPEQGHLEPILLRGSVTDLHKCEYPTDMSALATDQRWELKMISN